MFSAVTMFKLGFKERIGEQKLENLFLCVQEAGSWEFIFGSFHSFLLAFI